MSIEDDAALYYGFIYVTTNLVNDMKYIGKRKYTNYYKWYLGSGKLIKRDIQKYGTKNFRSDFYNIVPGGIGGGGVFNYLSESQQREASRQTKIPAPNIIKSIHSGGRLSAGKSYNGRKLHWKLVEVVN